MTLRRLVYISGSGRSGSTLLERIFHSSPDFVALGEFHCLWRLPPKEITCSCGTAYQDDRYWRSRLADAGITGTEIARLAELENRVCRWGYIAARGFSAERLGAEPEVQDFLALQFRLFDAIAAASGAPALVDSSKAGPRAWLLACDPRTRVVHLYRNPTDVIASWRSRKFDKGLGGPMQRLSVRRAALDWWKSEHLARKLGDAAPVLRVDYAELCAEPSRVAANLIAKLDVPAGPPKWLGSKQFEQGSDYHSLNGNPDRFETGPVSISSRGPDWTKYGRIDRLMIQSAGALLRGLYPSR